MNEAPLKFEVDLTKDMPVHVKKRAFVLWKTMFIPLLKEKGYSCSAIAHIINNQLNDSDTLPMDDNNVKYYLYRHRVN